MADNNGSLTNVIGVGKKYSQRALKETIGEPEQAATKIPAANAEQARPAASFGGFRYSQTRVLSVAPDVLRQRRIVVGSDNDAVTVAFKTLRTKLLQTMQARGMTTLAITSVHTGAGKTVTAVNLAVAMAMDPNHTVMLVDLDLRRPSVAATLGWKVECGVLDHVLDGVALPAALVHPGMGRLVVLPGRGALSNSSELLASPPVQRFVEEIKGKYDGRVVLFDMPAMSEGDDVLAFTPYVDGILLVVEENKTRRSEIEHALSLLPREKILGTVLNKSKT